MYPYQKEAQARQIAKQIGFAVPMGCNERPTFAQPRSVFCPIRKNVGQPEITPKGFAMLVFPNGDEEIVDHTANWEWRDERWQFTVGEYSQ